MDLMRKILQFDKLDNNDIELRANRNFSCFFLLFYLKCKYSFDKLSDGKFVEIWGRPCMKSQHFLGSRHRLKKKSLPHKKSGKQMCTLLLHYIKAKLKLIKLTENFCYPVIQWKPKSELKFIFRNDKNQRFSTETSPLKLVSSR